MAETRRGTRHTIVPYFARVCCAKEYFIYAFDTTNHDLISFLSSLNPTYKQGLGSKVGYYNRLSIK